MPYASNQGVRIYYEVEGQGPPLVLATGASADLTVWQGTGFTDALKDYQLILFDARGHGRSDKPHEVSAYAPNVAVKMAGDVIAVLDDAGIAKAHYYGYSLGALVGYRLAAGYSERFYSFILGGGSPYKLPDEGAEVLRQMVEGYNLLGTDPEAFLKGQAGVYGRPLSPEEKKRFLDLDAVALARIINSVLDLTPLTARDLVAIFVPCLLFCGEFDGWGAGAKESANYIKQAQFVSLKGYDHVTVPPDLIIRLIKEFLAQIREKHPHSHGGGNPEP
jgi:pimeloyl-ACP methyl ester carboxylesterase